MKKQIMEIKDLNSPDLEIYALRSEVALRHYYEPEAGLFIAESPKVIKRALDAGYEILSVLIEKKQLNHPVKEVEEVLLLINY